MKVNPLTAIDFYKADHRRQYPVGTTKVYSNFTPRSDKHRTIPDSMWTGEITFFGLQYFIDEYLRSWYTEFFSEPKQTVIEQYRSRMDRSLGKGAIPVDHIETLHDLQYLPLHIKALPEGTSVPIGVPVLTIENTRPDCFWLTNYMESALSTYLWLPSNSATIARHLRLYLERMAEKTGSDRAFVKWQGHDFSFRGMPSLQSARVSGAAHLLSFAGTDTVQAIDFLEEYYTGWEVGGSIPSTEHSVMCMGGCEGEFETFKRLVTEVYPSGMVSIVSDTWNLWEVLTDYVSRLKDTIMSRDGKVVFRPDSGDPYKIVCGDPEAEPGTPPHRGALQLLWDTFGGTTTKTGHRLLHPSVGLIYGDSISLPLAKKILDGMDNMGFASANIVLGVGSFTYQHQTRDTFGWAMKATYGEINGVGKDIFKNPVTDSGLKKSAKGRLSVVRDETSGKLTLLQGVTEPVPGDLLSTVMKDGVVYRRQTLDDIRRAMWETF